MRLLTSMTAMLFAISSILSLSTGAFAAAPPTITAQPSASSICAGANTTFSVNASDATGYQWQVDQGAGFANISNIAPYSGATTATLTIMGATAGLNGYQYRTVATGSVAPNALSNSAALTVLSAPQITAQPPASTIPAGGNTAFSAMASNATGYQWQVDQGAGFSNVPAAAPYSGTTTATLTITGATAGMNGYYYRVVATGVCTPNALSSPRLLTVVPPPTVTSISPTSGPISGGTMVTLTGANFTGATAVRFGAYPAASFTVTSAGSITATAPANAAATYDVTVTTPSGTSTTTAADQFTYIAPPLVQSVSPSTGPMAGGTIVTLYGSNFANTTAVTFGATAATGFTVNSASLITATAPAGTGTVDIRVTTPGGTSATSAADQYYYVPPPTISGITPASGTTAGGTAVTITGTSLTNAYSVSVGGSAVSSFTVMSPTQITATTASGTPGIGDIVVATAGGGATLTGSYEYVEPAIANAVSATVAANSSANAIPLNISGGAADAAAVVTAATHGTATASGTTITYTPTVGYSGTDSFTYTATNAAGTSAAATVLIAVTAPTLVLVPSSGAIPGGRAGQAYNQTLTASGGTAPNTFQIVAGAPPPGVTVQATGTLSGTPTATGTYNFIVEARDTYGATGIATYSLTAVCPLVSFIPPNSSALAAGTTGVPYSQTFSSSGTTQGSFTISGNLPTGLTFDDATNTLSGTPTQTGGSALYIDFTDAYGCAYGAQYTIDVAYPTISMAPAAGAMPDGETGVAYSQTVSASGGSAPYSYAVTAGTLPTGLTFNAATATLSGAPSVTGSSSFTISATDAYGATTDTAYTMAVAFPTLTLSPAAGALPTGTTGVAYNQSISASGGSAPYSYVVSAGSLPGGMTIDAATGTLSGTPSGTGNSNFTVTATDTHGASTATTYSLSVAFPAITISPATGALPGGTTGVTYNQSISASGGSAPYSYVVSAGFLPAGLVLDAATGTLSGTPSATGNSSFTVTATDTHGASTATAYSLGVAFPAITLSPAAGAVAGGTTGLAYSQAISASGGSSPYNYALSAGVLPAGLTLDSATGTVSGAPTAAGNFGFTIAATDTYGASGTAAYILAVVPGLQPPIANAVSSTIAANSSANAIALNITGGGADSVAIGAPPAHGTANAAGTTIRYTPATGYSGPDSFTYTATNPAGTSTAATVTITVTAPAFTFVPAAGSLAEAMAGEDYRQQITATGGRAPMLYGISSGALPKGMVLNISTGELTGPLDAQAEGQYTFAIRAEDSNGASQTATYSLTVTPARITVGDRVVDVPAGSTPPDVYLNRGATGGPFTSAELTLVEPANAGTARITRGQLAQAGPIATPTGWYLQFTPNAAYTGKARVGYRLTSALGVSNTGTITYNLVFGAEQVAEEIDTLVRGFVQTRQSLISSGIHVPGLLERRQVQQAADAVTARMTPSQEGITATFSTSIAQLDAARDRADGFTDTVARPFNAWVDLTFLAHSRDENNGKWGNFTMLNIGGDYLLSPKALVGLSFHYDRMTDPTDEDAELTGNGWLAGPYASLELGRGVFWDTSLLYGGSANDIDTTFWDGTFDTTRWMLDTQVNGQWSLDQTTVLTPKVRAVYFSETVDDYKVRNAAGDQIAIDGFDAEQFRISLGAEIERSFTLDNGSTLTPKLGATAGYAGLDGSGAFGNLTAGVSLATADLWLLDLGLLVNFGEDGEKSLGGRARASKQF